MDLNEFELKEEFENLYINLSEYKPIKELEEAKKVYADLEVDTKNIKDLNNKLNKTISNILNILPNITDIKEDESIIKEIEKNLNTTSTTTNFEDLILYHYGKDLFETPLEEFIFDELLQEKQPVYFNGTIKELLNYIDEIEEKNNCRILSYFLNGIIIDKNGVNIKVHYTQEKIQRIKRITNIFKLTQGKYLSLKIKKTMTETNLSKFKENIEKLNTLTLKRNTLNKTISNNFSRIFEFEEVLNDTRKYFGTPPEESEIEYNIFIKQNIGNTPMQKTPEEELFFKNVFKTFNNHVQKNSSNELYTTANDVLTRIFDFIEENEHGITTLINYHGEKIKKQKILVDKASRTLTKFENGKTHSISKILGKDKSSEKYDILMKLESHNNDKTPILPFDELILETLFSLKEEREYIDIQTIKDSYSKTTNRHVVGIDKEIIDSIEKLRKIDLTITIPITARNVFVDNDGKFLETDLDQEINNRLLPIERRRFTKRGNSGSKKNSEENEENINEDNPIEEGILCYKFTEEQPLYLKYINSLMQFQTTEAELLKLGKIQLTPETMLLKRELARRINNIKHYNNKNNSKNNYKKTKGISKILFHKSSNSSDDGLLDIVGVIEENFDTKAKYTKEKHKIKEKIEKILDDYIDNKIIKGFSILKDGIEIKI